MSSSLDVVEADVMDPSSVQAAMTTGPDAVVSTYGVSYTRRPVSIYSRGIEAVIEAMNAHGVSRLVCVTSTTVAPGPGPGDTLVWRVVLGPLLRRVFGRTLYDDMERMETLVRASDLEWTIVRPGGLFDSDEPTADRQVSTHRLAGHNTSRADLARVLLEEAVEPRHSRSIIEVITRSGLPGFTTFAKEALSRSDAATRPGA